MPGLSSFLPRLLYSLALLFPLLYYKKTDCTSKHSKREIFSFYLPLFTFTEQRVLIERMQCYYYRKVHGYYIIKAFSSVLLSSALTSFCPTTTTITTTTLQAPFLLPLHFLLCQRKNRKYMKMERKAIIVWWWQCIFILWTNITFLDVFRKGVGVFCKEDHRLFW